MNGKKNIQLYLALILIFTGYSCGNKEHAGQNSPDPVSVVTYTVKSENVVYYDTYPATVAALNEIQLRSEVSGYVTGIFFREGSHVKKGDKLYEIDRRKYQASWEAARANAEIAGSNLQKAQRDADRYKKLDEENAIARQVLDDGLTALENAKMQVKLAAANLLNAETDYNYSLITAPFSGIIGFSSVKPGAFVTAGQTLLTSVSSDDPVGLDFSIDQKSLPYLLRLQKDRIADNDSVFKLTMPDNSDYQYNGKLSIIDRAIDPLTGTIKIRVVFKNPEDFLRPGMNCKIKVVNENSGMHVVIPVRSTVEQMGETIVYLVDNNKANQHRIIPGANLGEFMIVTEGLKAGDRIILDGIQNVHEGTMLNINDSRKSVKGVMP